MDLNLLAVALPATCCSGSASFELVLIRQDVFTVRQLAGEL